MESRLYALVIMPNHLHPVASAVEQLHAVMYNFNRLASWTIRIRLKQEGRETIRTGCAGRR